MVVLNIIIFIHFGKLLISRNNSGIMTSIRAHQSLTFKCFLLPPSINFMFLTENEILLLRIVLFNLVIYLVRERERELVCCKYKGKVSDFMKNCQETGWMMEARLIQRQERWQSS